MQKFLNIDRRKNDPIEDQIIFSLKKYLYSQSIAPLTAMPNAVEIARQYGIEPSVILEYYKTQEQAGFLIHKDDEYYKAQKEIFTFDQDSNLNQHSLTEYIRELGHDVQSSIVSIENVQPSLRLPFGPKSVQGDWLKITRITHVNHQANAAIFLYISKDQLKGVETLGFESDSIMKELEGYRELFGKSERFMTASDISDEAADLLKVPRKTPGYVTTQFNYGHDQTLLLYIEVATITEALYVHQSIPYPQNKRL